MALNYLVGSHTLVRLSSITGRHCRRQSIGALGTRWAEMQTIHKLWILVLPRFLVNQPLRIRIALPAVLNEVHFVCILLAP